MAEFRIFLPILSDSIVSVLGSPSLSRYQEIVLTMLQAVESTDSLLSPIEDRTDIYVVTNNHFGLKYRGEKKLELKIRTGRDESINMETWIKLKIGKKNPSIGNLSSSIPDVLSILSRYHVLEASDEYLIQQARLITTKKRRRAIEPLLASVSHEICIIELGDDYKQLCGVSATSRWLSVCFEGDPMAVMNFSNIKVHDALFEAMRILHDIASSDAALTREYRIYPVIGGYPTWLCSLTSDESFRQHMDVIVKPILTRRKSA
jgi:hypothetical protein